MYIIHKKWFPLVAAHLRGLGVKNKDMKAVPLAELQSYSEQGAVVIAIFRTGGNLWEKYSSKLRGRSIILPRPFSAINLVRRVRKYVGKKILLGVNPDMTMILPGKVKGETRTYLSEKTTRSQEDSGLTPDLEGSSSLTLHL